MAQLSRGAIEEGTVTFDNQTEVAVTFAAASFQNIGFNTPPVVKLIGTYGTDGGDAPENINSNIGVAFRDVTVNGMTVITSAPFTGTIRYLCSVNG